MPRYRKRFDETLQSKQWLERVYLDEKRNAEQVALMIGCTRTAVHAALKRHGIPVRGRSEAMKLSTCNHGSSAPRPRGHLIETIHNPTWLQARVSAGLSGTKIARLASCSSAAVSHAMKKFNIERKVSSEAIAELQRKRQKTAPAPSAKHTAWQGRRIARETLPPGPCVLCGKPGRDVNHKDRNPRNNPADGSNWERLCAGCHIRQHRKEEQVTIEWLRERFNVPYIEIHNEARKRLLEART